MNWNASFRSPARWRRPRQVDLVALRPAEVEDAVRAAGALSASARRRTGRPRPARRARRRRLAPPARLTPSVADEPVVEERADEVLDAEQAVTAGVGATGGAAGEVRHHGPPRSKEKLAVSIPAPAAQLVVAGVAREVVVAATAPEPVVAPPPASCRCRPRRGGRCGRVAQRLSQNAEPITPSMPSRWSPRAWPPTDTAAVELDAAPPRALVARIVEPVSPTIRRRRRRPRARRRRPEPTSVSLPPSPRSTLRPSAPAGSRVADRSRPRCS